MNDKDKVTRNKEEHKSSFNGLGFPEDWSKMKESLAVVHVTTLHMVTTVSFVLSSV